MDRSIAICEANGVQVDTLRPVDYDLPVGVQPDMTEHGWAVDEWPALFERVLAADVVVIGTPIWLGERSSVCTAFIERLYGSSGQLNEAGQSIYYGRAGGCLVTGNEDGIKHCAMGIRYALSHLGYTVPPQPDAGWIGESGPGRVCDLEPAAHCAPAARRRRVPAHGNQRTLWAAGCRFDYPNPEHRA